MLVSAPMLNVGAVYGMCFSFFFSLVFTYARFGRGSVEVFECPASFLRYKSKAYYA